jgi:hypothetical protein
MKRIVVGVVVLVLAVAGVAIGGYLEGASHGLRPLSLQQALPKMVSAFGSDAHIVEIVVGSSDVYFQVIGADGQLQIRDYAVVESEIGAGTYGYNRKTRDYVRSPSAAESRGAVLTLGQIDPSVVDKLYDKVGFPRNGSSATLTGRSWFLESGARPDHQYLAAYDGSGLRTAQSPAPPNPNAPGTSPTVAATPSTTSKASTTTVFSFSTTISSHPTSPHRLHTAQRLAACIEHAQGDVSKIAACQRRFVP